MLNPSFVGRVLPATEPVELTAASIEAFASALGVPFDGVSAPPTYLVSLSLPAASPLLDDAEFGLDFSRVLHREQRFELQRPARVGDRVSCTVRVEDVKTVAGNELLTLRTEVCEAKADEPFAVVWTTLFVAAEEAA